MSGSHLQRWLRVGAAGCLLFLISIVVTLVLFQLGDLPFTPRCPWWTLTETRCPGCGLTRGFSALLHGDLVTALGYNVLVVVVPPLFVLVGWLLGVFAIRGDLPTLPEIPLFVGWLVFFGLAGFWLYRIVVDLCAR